MNYISQSKCMKKENNSEQNISNRLTKARLNAGFKAPDNTYFDTFSDSVISRRDRKKVAETPHKNWMPWIRTGSFAAAALLILALWLFVFDANISKQDNFTISVDELMALNDFENFDAQMIYNELEFTTENLAINEQELDVLTHMEGLSTEEIIDIYIDNEIK